MPMVNLSSWYPSSLVKKLLGWKQGDEEEKWAEKAIQSLVKKLAKNKTAVEDLEFALSNPGLLSKCVTIPRSLDGRLQVSHRKGLPHVIYCRVWRWPDLTSQHELKSLDCCRYAFNAKQKEVCINPYHYKRVTTSVPLPCCPEATEHQQSMQHQYGGTSGLKFDQLNLNVTGGIPTTQALSPTNFSYISNDSPSSNDSEDEDGRGQKWTMESEQKYVGPQRILWEVRKCCWCSIAYYELNNRVGEAFNVYSKSVSINGFTDPTLLDQTGQEDRFCLGLLSNVNRNSTVEKTRRNIGNGVRLWTECHYPHKSRVKIQCLSENAIFVQSRIFNILNHYDPATVAKVPPNATLSVFDEKFFCESFRQAKQLGYMAVYELTKMCSVRISFVKGWGVEYRRHDITSTPCWIEITFFEPLKILDEEMKALEAPNISLKSGSK